LADEFKTEVIRRALIERRTRLQARRGHDDARGNLREYLERHVWPLIPPEAFGRILSRDEEDTILGYGPKGY
jgi:antitoxin VapB